MRARRPGIWGNNLGTRVALGMVALVAVFWLSACGGSSTGTSPGGAKTAYIGTQTVESYAVTLRVSPATFGYNTFSVTLKNSGGTLINDASVEIVTTMLDMAMPTQSTKLSPAKTSPGVYTGGSQLPMAGHWQVAVKVTPPSSAQSFAVDFKFSATYS
jgi:YtkA-like